MRYFYLSRNAMIQGDIKVLDVFDYEIPLEFYRTGTDKEDAIQYIGENIPNDLEYDIENDFLFSKADRPSPYHAFVKGIWIIKDKTGFERYNAELVDKFKAETLEYGFMYQGHEQKCRDKDVTLMTTITAYLKLTKDVLGIEEKSPWVFQDDYLVELDLTSAIILMIHGKTFVESVYKAENYFKTLDTQELTTKEMFEEKRAEIHKELVKRDDINGYFKDN